MKFIIETMRNEKGNVVFDKFKSKNEWWFSIRNDKGETRLQPKSWVLANKDRIVNLGIDKNGSMYPVKIQTNRDKVANITMNPIERVLWVWTDKKVMNRIENIIEMVNDSELPDKNEYARLLVNLACRLSDIKALNKALDFVKKGGKLNIKNRDLTEKEKTEGYALAVIDSIHTYLRRHMENPYGYISEAYSDWDVWNNETYSKSITEEMAQELWEDHFSQMYDVHGVYVSTLGEDLDELEERNMLDEDGLINNLISALQGNAEKLFKYEKAPVAKLDDNIDWSYMAEVFEECKQDYIERNGIVE